MVGIFRHSGDSVNSERIMHNLVDGMTLDVWLLHNYIPVFDMCQAIKLYLVKVRLVPLMLYPIIEEVQILTDPNEITESVTMILLLLEPARFYTLKRVVEFFGRVVEHSAKNQMNGRSDDGMLRNS